MHKLSKMLSSLVGRRNITFVKSWVGSGALFGTAASWGFLYVTDWKLILQYLPIYNTKFKEQED